MKKEYIERDYVLRSLSEKMQLPFSDIDDAWDVVQKAPAADVAEVVHAKWKWMHGCAGYGIYCTNCQSGWPDSENVELIAYSHDYCAKCGAKMDAGEVEL